MIPTAVTADPPAPPGPPERWAPWQWLVVTSLAILVVASTVQLVRHAWPSPVPSSALPLGFQPLTPDQEIAAYQRQLGPAGSNPLVLTKLAQAYVRKARATSDLAWYLLAEQAARRSLAQVPKDPDARIVLSRVLLARHDFPGALALIAATEVTLGKGPETGGLRFDVHMAQGDLAGAGKDLLQLGPYGVSLARHGLYLDATGQDEKAQRALLASIQILANSDPETVAWTHVNLANVLLREGHHVPASYHLDRALAALPGYVPALIGQAELARREGHWPEIFRLLAPVVALTPRADLDLRLAEAARAMGDTGAAARRSSDAGLLLEQEQAAGTFGHRRDRVRWLLEQPDNAGLARAASAIGEELALRQDFETQLIAGEVAVRQGNLVAARQVLDQAADSGIHDARLWYWQGRAAPTPEAATAFLARARAQDPKFDQVALETAARHASVTK